MATVKFPEQTGEHMSLVSHNEHGACTILKIGAVEVTLDLADLKWLHMEAGELLRGFDFRPQENERFRTERADNGVLYLADKVTGMSTGLDFKCRGCGKNGFVTSIEDNGVHCACGSVTP